MRRRLLKSFGALLVLLVLGVVVAVAAWEWTHAEHIYPGVTASDGTLLGSITRQEASATLVQQADLYSRDELRLRDRNGEWLASVKDLGGRPNTEQVLGAAYKIGREGNLLQQLGDQLDALRSGRTVALPIVTLDEDRTAAFLTGLAKEIDRPVIDARLVIDADLRANVQPSQVGRELDIPKAVRLVASLWASVPDNPLDLPVEETPPGVMEADLEPSRAALNTMLAAPLTLRFENRAWTLSRQDIAKLLNVDDYVKDPGSGLPKLDGERLIGYVRGMAQEIDQAPLKPRLAFNAGKVQTIREGRPGYQLDVDATVAAVKNQVATDSRTVALPVGVIQAAGLAADRATIKELVASASTSYAGSLPERSYNIELAATKLNGVVVGPGEIFSFNEELGPMTLQAGFKWGWGITQSEGQVATVPSVAGGICQVSSTLFQAIFWAGYQIEERNWHLYWINRYGQPPTGLKGLDATVDQVYDANGKLTYAIDLKFKNTTPNPILVEAKAAGGKLTFSLYSTKPGWVVKVDPPKIEDIVKADPTVVREVDPSLPPGKDVWVEAAEDGFKSTIVRTVIEDGKEPRVLRLISTYKPSRNVALVGPPLGAQSTPPSSPAPTPNPIVPGEKPAEGD
ncbi:MAG: VanW family protein [Chloroflexi bacterium]|nr:VanW family protein [Chloroflexota bacterium]